MAHKLTKKEIYARMQEWRNIKKLHAAARDRIEAQQKTITLLKENVQVLEARDHEKDTVIAELKLQIEELKRMIFGRRRKREQQPEDEDGSIGEPQPKTPRTPASYHRPLPKDEEITHTEHHGLDACPGCGTPLETHETRTFYYNGLGNLDSSFGPTLPCQDVQWEDYEKNILTKSKSSHRHRCHQGPQNEQSTWQPVRSASGTSWPLEKATRG